MRTILVLYIHDGDSQKGYGFELAVMKEVMIFIKESTAVGSK
jgi:hypothetical protein